MTTVKKGPTFMMSICIIETGKNGDQEKFR